MCTLRCLHLCFKLESRAYYDAGMVDEITNAKSIPVLFASTIADSQPYDLPLFLERILTLGDRDGDTDKTKHLLTTYNGIGTTYPWAATRVLILHLNV